jgi:hypothetical protein
VALEAVVVGGVEAHQEQLVPEHRRGEHGHHNPELAACRLSGEEVGGERDGHVDGEVEVHGGMLEAVGLWRESVRMGRSMSWAAREV